MMMGSRDLGPKSWNSISQPRHKIPSNCIIITVTIVSRELYAKWLHPEPGVEENQRKGTYEPPLTATTMDGFRLSSTLQRMSHRASFGAPASKEKGLWRDENLKICSRKECARVWRDERACLLDFKVNQARISLAPPKEATQLNEQA